MRRWMRFNYMDPMPIINNQTGRKTGKSLVYLRAVRSDNFLYQVHVQVDDLELENPGFMDAVQVGLRDLLEPYLNDEPAHVMPMTVENPYKGVEGWMEATIQ